MIDLSVSYLQRIRETEFHCVFKNLFLAVVGPFKRDQLHHYIDAQLKKRVYPS